MRKTTVSTITTLILVLAGIALLATGCKKEGEHHPARGKDAVVRIRVQDEKGNSLGGIPILIYDETGYEKFEKNRNTPPTDRTVTQADGEIVYRLPYDKWLKKGSRFLSFVIYERLDDDNYRIWAASRTIVAGKEERIDFELEMTRREKPLLGTPLDLYDENNGRTLFAQALYLDAEHRFAGANRYSMVDVGPVSGVEELGELRLDGFTDRTDAQLRHGYFICKDVSLKEFPSGKWGLAIESDYARAYLADWLYDGGKIVGAHLRYTMHKPEGHGLPQWKRIYGVSLTGDRTTVIDLAEVREKCEFAAGKSHELQYEEEEPGKVSVRITDPKAARGKSYPFNIRSGVYYTEVSIEITD